MFATYTHVIVDCSKTDVFSQIFFFVFVASIQFFCSHQSANQPFLVYTKRRHYLVVYRPPHSCNHCVSVVCVFFFLVKLLQQFFVLFFSCNSSSSSNNCYSLALRTASDFFFWLVEENFIKNLKFCIIRFNNYQKKFFCVL